MSFTASPIVSPFPDQNALFDPAKAIETGQTIQQNQLHMQGQQIDLSNANMAQVGQAAAGLLSAYPDEASRAAAYPRVVGMLQSQGYALHAPSEYPGEGVLRSMVNQSIPAKDLYSSGALLTPAQQAALGQTGQTGTTGTSTTGAAAPSSVPIPARGTGGPGASASAPTAWLPYFEEASKETGIPVDLLLAQARQESSFNPNNVGKSGEIGLFQIMPSTARSPGPGMQGVDPASITGPDNVRNNIMFGARYLKAQMGGGDPNNPAVQAAALRRYNGVGPGGDPNYVQHVFGYRPTLAPSDPNAAVTAYTPPTAGATTASAAPTTAQPGQPVPTQVASNTPMVSTAPAASTAAPGGPPAAPQFTYPNGKVGGAPDAQGGVQYGDGSYGTPPPGRPVPVAAATPVPTPAQPGQPQGAPAAAPATAPASTSRLPDASTIPTGRNSVAWQQAQQLIDQGNRLMIASGSNAGMRASAERMIQQGTQQQQLDHMVPAQQDGRPGNLNTTTGAFTYASPLPSPRGMQGTAGAWDGTKWVPVTPENQANAVQGTWAVTGSGAQFYPNSPATIQRQEEAKTSGAAASSTASVQLYNGIIARAQAAQKSEGDIDYASNQLAQAAKRWSDDRSFFSPAMATAAAVAKSLGLTDAMRAGGVDPSTVGNIKSAKKTLAVLGASILQQALGKDSQITDAKIQAYEHTQPGIENDPQALQRIMAWARIAEFTYERELGHAAAVEAGNNGGILPPTFLPRYYANVGFAPVYDSVSGEMRQPDGRQPARETPATLTTAPINPAARTTGAVYSTPKGPMKWTGTGWLPVQ